MTVQVNQATTAAGDPGARLDWTTALDTATGTLPPFATSPTSTLTADVELAAGGHVEIDAFGFALVEGSFELVKGTVTGSDAPAGGATPITLTDAESLALTLSGVSLFVGAGGQFDATTGDAEAGDDGIGLEAGVTELKLVLLTAGTTKYTGLVAEDLTASFVGVDDLVVTVSGVDLRINQVSPAGGTRLDWASFTPTSAPLPLLEGLTRDLELSASGDVTIDVFGFALVAGSFGVQTGTVTGSDAPAVGDPITLTDAESLVLTLSGVSIFVGMGGEFDATTGAAQASANGIGLEAGVADLKLVMLTAGTTKYTGLAIEDLAASFVGVDGLVVEVADVDLRVNRVSDPAGTRLDWASFTPLGSLPELEGLTRDVELSASGDVTIDVFGFALVAGSFGVETGTVSGSDDPAAGDPVTLADAEKLVLTLSGVSVFVGVGGEFDATTGAAQASADGIGLEAGLDDLTLVLLTAGTTKYTGLVINDLGGSLEGIDGLVVEVSNVDLLVNKVSTVGGTRLDWASFEATSGSLPALELTRDAELSVGGDVTIDLFGFALVAGSFGLETGTVSGSDAPAVGDPVTLADAEKLVLTLSGVSVFVGVGGEFDPTTGAAQASADGIGLEAGLDDLTLVMLTAGTTKYTGLVINDLGGSLEGIDGLVVEVSNVDLLVNKVSTVGGTRLDWASFAATSGSLPALDLMRDVELSVGGDVTIDVFGFVLAEGTFGLQTGTVTGSDAPAEGDPVVLTDAESLVLTLEGVSVFVGVGGQFNATTGDAEAGPDGIGLVAGVDELALVMLTAGTAKYTGLVITNLSGSLEGIDGLVVDVSGVDVGVNQVSPVGATRLDWATFGPVVDGTLPDMSSLTRDVELSASGHVELDVFGFVLAEASFGLVKGTLSGSDDPPDPDGAGPLEPEPVTLTDAPSLTLTLTGASVFVGVGGQFNATTGDAEASDAGIGLVASVGELALVMATQGTTKYTALAIRDLGGSLAGIDGLVVEVSEVDVLVNQVSVVGATRMDWATFTPADNLPDLTGLTRDVELSASGHVELDVFGFVLAEASFGLVKGTLSGSDDPPDPDGAGPLEAPEPVTLTDAPSLTLTLTGASVFVGVGGQFNATTGDAEASDAGIGLVASVGELALVMATQGTTKYTALAIRDLGGSLEGIDGLVVEVSEVDVLVNQVSVVGATRMDWATFTPADNLPDLTGLTRDVELSASGHVELDVFGFVLAEASFGLVKGTLSGSDDPASGDPVTLTGAQSLVLTLTGASLFVGVGGQFNDDDRRRRGG